MTFCFNGMGKFSSNRCPASATAGSMSAGVRSSAFHAVGTRAGITMGSVLASHTARVMMFAVCG